MNTENALKFGNIIHQVDGKFSYSCKACNIIKEGHHNEFYALLGLITHCNWHHTKNGNHQKPKKEITAITRQSQRLRLLKALRSGRWVSMPKLIRLMGGYRLSARVWELRKQGWQIFWRDRYRGQTRLVEYRLER